MIAIAPIVQLAAEHALSFHECKDVVELSKLQEDAAYSFDDLMISLGLQGHPDCVGESVYMATFNTCSERLANPDCRTLN